MTHTPMTREDAQRSFKAWEAKHRHFLRPAADALIALGYTVDFVDTGCALVAAVDFAPRYQLQVVSAEQMEELNGDSYSCKWIVSVWDEDGDEQYMLDVPDARAAVRESLVELVNPRWQS